LKLIILLDDKFYNELSNYIFLYLIKQNMK